MTHYRSAEWLEWSGLPAALNAVRTHGWLVFKAIVERDCAAHRWPEAVEITLDELARRTGLGVETVGKVIEALRKKRYLRVYMPEEPAEPALLEICVPIPTPLTPEDVVRETPDPGLRDPRAWRYLREADARPPDESKVQEVIDCYLNQLSHKVNTFVVEQIELCVRRFPVEDIRRMIDRAARHDIHSMGWVLKELIREERKKRAQGRDQIANRL